MISGFAQPVATGIGLGRQQDSGGQDRRGGNEHSKLTHGFLPLESSSVSLDIPLNIPKFPR
jgi:hypothetical protein